MKAKVGTMIKVYGQFATIVEIEYDKDEIIYHLDQYITIPNFDCKTDFINSKEVEKYLNLFGIEI
jgi:hypothetical protein